MLKEDGDTFNRTKQELRQHFWDWHCFLLLRRNSHVLIILTFFCCEISNKLYNLMPIIMSYSTCLLQTLHVFKVICISYLAHLVWYFCRTDVSTSIWISFNLFRKFELSQEHQEHRNVCIYHLYYRDTVFSNANLNLVLTYQDTTKTQLHTSR